MRRFWFPLQNNFGIGVTAVDETDARALAQPVLATGFYDGLELVETIADVDVQTLDQHHVIPNMGVVSIRGVWFPHR